MLFKIMPIDIYNRKLSNFVGESMNKLIVLGITAMAVSMLAGIVAASGANQYGNGFPISSSGYCHGAFANTNGAPGAPGPSGPTWTGGVRAGQGAAGYDNSVFGGCTRPSGQ